jgi:dihydrofolate reductase
MSLDGFITASNIRPEEPLGDGGQILHEWAFGGSDDDREVLVQGGSATGAVIAGRRTYDTSVPWWGADGPTGPARLPVFVVTHNVPGTLPEGGVYTFVTGGIGRALQEAKAAAGDRNVTVMGRADIAQRFIRAGLVDELSIHLVQDRACTDIPIPRPGSSVPARPCSRPVVKKSKAVPATSWWYGPRLPTSSRISATGGWRSSASTHRPA